MLWQNLIYLPLKFVLIIANRNLGSEWENLAPTSLPLPLVPVKPPPRPL